MLSIFLVYSYLKTITTTQSLTGNFQLNFFHQWTIKKKKINKDSGPNSVLKNKNTSSQKFGWQNIFIIINYRDKLKTIQQILFVHLLYNSSTKRDMTNKFSVFTYEITEHVFSIRSLQKLCPIFIVFTFLIRHKLLQY